MTGHLGGERWKTSPTVETGAEFHRQADCEEKSSRTAAACSCQGTNLTQADSRGLRCTTCAENVCLELCAGRKVTTASGKLSGRPSRV